MAAATLVPFGKYKGSPVEDMLADSSYMAWLEAQPWFREKFVHLLPSGRKEEMSQTPAHNRLQALFLDPAYRLAFIETVVPDSLGNTYWDWRAEREELRSAIRFSSDGKAEVWAVSEIARLKAAVPIEKSATYVSFEAVSYEPWDVDRKHSVHSDVWICLRHKIYSPWLLWRIDEKERQAKLVCRDKNICFPIEVKPTVADEYPAVLRQMQKNRSRYLFVERYAGTGVTQEQFVEIFQESGRTVVFKEDVDTTAFFAACRP